MSTKTSFPNLARLAAILIVLPVTTATVEKTFSSIKLSRLDFVTEWVKIYAMRICIEGPDQLSNELLKTF